jgi:hypothetical protein
VRTRIGLRFAAVGALVAVVCAARPAVPQAPVPLAPRVLLDGLIEMLVPVEFQPMSAELLRQKYPTDRPPALALANAAGSVSVALNHTRTRLPVTALSDAHRHLEQTFRSVHPTAQWFRSELMTVKGREWILLDLRTPAIDTEVRNLLMATSVDERLLLIAVNMTKALEGEWLDAANRMIESVVIRP